LEKFFSFAHPGFQFAGPGIANNTLAQTFFENSSSKQYSNKFQSFRCRAARHLLNIKSINFESYNSFFLHG